MKITSIFRIIGISAIIGLVIITSCNSKQNTKSTEISETRIEKRNLKLTVMAGFEGDQKTISENATSEIIKSTMHSINWEEFHIVQLEDLNSTGFKALHVSGSLSEDGLASGLVTDDDHILITKPITTVEQIIEILLDFLKGEDVWRDKYEYK